MSFSATAVPLADILPLRAAFCREMNCQIVQNSLHTRPGWTQAYLIDGDGTPAGYGAIAIGGPWKDTRTVFEFYLDPEYRGWVVECFDSFLKASAATHFEFQTNNLLLTALTHTWNVNLSTERIIFHDQTTTHLPANGVVFRQATDIDATDIFAHHAEPVGDWVLEFEGTVIATGGILHHYNHPYSDIYMEVSSVHRRRGFGTYLVQELKRICRESGRRPCCRCSPSNLASLKTIQKAGFVPCAHILAGAILTKV